MLHAMTEDDQTEMFRLLLAITAELSHFLNVKNFDRHLACFARDLGDWIHELNYIRIKTKQRDGNENALCNIGDEMTAPPAFLLNLFISFSRSVF